jgi:putative ABC transport system substrate-binding protein
MAPRRARRRFLRSGLTLAGLGLLTGCAGPSLTWPLGARARVPRIGYLGVDSAAGELEAFRDGLSELGYLEGQTIALELRWAQSNEQFPALAAELVGLPVDLIVTAGAGPATQAAIDATRTIPIVFAPAPDPVRTGFVSSLAHPGGNVTGVSNQAPQVQGKRLQLLREIVPGASRVLVLTITALSRASGALQEMQEAAQPLGLELLTPDISTSADIRAALELAVSEQVGAVFATGQPQILRERGPIVEFMTANRLPVLAQDRAFTEVGGLISYGPSRPALSRRAAAYVDKILKGTRPADLPVEQPTVFDLVVNLKTAQVLRLTISDSVLQQATELIQYPS